MKNIPYIIFLISVIFTQSTFAQDGGFITVRDLESWNSLNLKYKVKPHWKIGVEQQLRLNNNASDFDAYFTEFNSDYYFSDKVIGAIGFRYIRENDKEGDVQGLENHMRFHFDLGYTTEVQRLKVEYRLRFQTKNELGISSDQGDFANNHLRFKVAFKYNIKKWKLDPEFSSELFRHYEKGERNGFDKYRITFGTKYKIKGFGKIGAFFRMEKELNISYPKITNIIGLKYTYTLRNDKKRINKKDDEEEIIWY